ncbi:MAG: rhodanese-like domain-containing protein [Candidatus Kapaibacteriota bacterium]|jgi:rhodanese-related sulfurtransferase
MNLFNKQSLLTIGSILIVSLGLALLNNYLSKKPLPYTPQPIETISDDDLFGDLESENTIKTQKNIDSTISISQNTAILNLDSIKKINKRIADSLAKLKKDIELGKVNLNNDGNKDAAQSNIEKTVTYEQVKKLLNNPNFYFIDARSAEDYAKGKIGNSINIFPYDEESVYFPKILSLPRDKKFIIYCTGGNCDLSHHLAEDMINFNFTNIFIYTGGWEEWELKNK